MSTFSKTVALGIRIGWIIASEEVIKCLEKIKQISDLHVNTYNQYVMASFIESGGYKKHVEKVIETYYRKRNVMVKALQEYLKGVSFLIPEGGFYIWVTFDEDISMRRLFEKCVHNNVVFTPGYHFRADGKDNSPQMRLNFTYPSEDEIISGIQQIALCYEELKETKVK